MTQSTDKENLSPSAASEAASPLQEKFTVLIPQQEIDRELDNLADKFGSKVRIHGFRHGRVPKGMVKKVYQKELTDDVLHELINQYARKEIQARKWRLAGQPVLEKMEFTDNQDLQASLTVEILPDFSVPNLDEFVVEVPAAVSKGEPFDEAKQMDIFLEAHQQRVPVKDRSIQDRDVVLVHLQSQIMDSKRMSPKKETLVQIGGEARDEIPGLAGELLGKNSEETLTLVRRYPEDYLKKIWAGKEVTHHIKIGAIFEWKKPNLDDQFLKRFGAQSEDEFKSKLRQEYEQQMERQKERVHFEYAVKQLLALTDFPVPNSLVNSEASRRLSSQGQALHFPDQAAKEQYVNDLITDAKRSVKFGLILDKIREKYGVQVQNDDLEKEYRQLAERHGLPEKDVRRYYADPEKAENLRLQLLDNKVIELIKKKIRIKEV